MEVSIPIFPGIPAMEGDWMEHCRNFGSEEGIIEAQINLFENIISLVDCSRQIIDHLSVVY